MRYHNILFITAVIAIMHQVAEAFTTAPNQMLASQSHFVSSSKLSMAEAEVEADPTEIIGRRIIVSGDVDGGYVRTCINNEVSSQHSMKHIVCVFLVLICGQFWDLYITTLASTEIPLLLEIFFSKGWPIPKTARCYDTT